MDKFWNFATSYADNFYKDLNEVRETLRIIIPLVFGITMEIMVVFVTIGLIMYIIERLKEWIKKKGNNNGL